MKDWEDIIKERQLSRKADLPESDWNDFLSRQAEHERAARRRRKLITLFISVPAAAAVLLLLFLMPFKTIVPDNQFAQNESSEPQVLAEVTVNPVVAKVHMVNDSVVFNSAAYRLPDSSSVEELISRLPGVQIDSAGNITVNGKSVSRILVNGKEFFNDDKTKSLTQLTAEMIEKVKAYEKNSDLSRQTGIDDGIEATVEDLRDVKIKGTVCDSDTDEPLKNAVVQIYKVSRKDSALIYSTMTGKDGSFVIYNLKRGKYVARVSLEGYNNGEMSFKVRRSRSHNNDIVKITLISTQ